MTGVQTCALPILFAIIVIGKEMRTTAPGQAIVGAEDERYWVVLEEGGWVEATSTRLSFHKDKIPPDLKTFKTAEAAENFAKKWTGHPWWCSPKSHEVVEVEPVYKKVPDGYRAVAHS